MKRTSPDLHPFPPKPDLSTENVIGLHGPISRVYQGLKALLPFLLLLSALFNPACYSSTAVKGTPVKDLVLAQDERVMKKVPSPTEKKEIALLSQVRENKVFSEIAGVAEYRIGPRDILQVNSHSGQNVTQTMVTVDSLGKISYSFIDDLRVEGLTPSQLDTLLTQQLSRYVKNPRIHVLVDKFRSKYATLMGEFSILQAGVGNKAESGRIFLEGKTSLMDLLALAGGFTKDADIKNTRLIRGGKSHRINLFDIIEKADDTQNIVIDSGDIVELAELPQFGERVYVMGEVASQGIYPLKDAQDLLSAIALAGSITSLAKQENTLIVRQYEPNKKPVIMMADLKAILRQGDITQNIRLADGDLVYVPRMLIGDINEWIANTTPLLNFLLYPKTFQDAYFMRNYLHLDRHHHK